MKMIKCCLALIILLSSVACNSQNKITAEFYIKFKANNIPYQILFLKPGESGYDHPSDSTISIRNLDRLTDSVILDNGSANFRFEFYKKSNSANYKTISLTIEKNFTLNPREYKIADFDLDQPITFEQRNSGYDGLVEYNIPSGQLFSWQYSWVKNHKPAKWTITKVDKATKTISGKFSFTATQAESNGSTDMSKRHTFLKIKEVDITEGEFHLPYTIIN